VAKVLGIRKRSDAGFIIVGANSLGRRLARALVDWGEDVVLIDSNPSDAALAEKEGLDVIYGNAHDQGILQRADIEGRRAFIAVTPNEGANLLMAQEAKSRFRTRSFAALRRGKAAVTVGRAEEAGVGVLFGEPIDLDAWIRTARNPEARVAVWENEGTSSVTVEAAVQQLDQPDMIVLPLFTCRRTTASPAAPQMELQRGDQLLALTAPQSDREAALSGYRTSSDAG
jgi:Trk K+ transport system NAD-binding subunit